MRLNSSRVHSKSVFHQAFRQIKDELKIDIIYVRYQTYGWIFDFLDKSHSELAMENRHRFPWIFIYFLVKLEVYVENFPSRCKQKLHIPERQL